jgi:hypothetical protein
VLEEIAPGLAHPHFCVFLVDISHILRNSWQVNAEMASREAVPGGFIRRRRRSVRLNGDDKWSAKRLSHGRELAAPGSASECLKAPSSLPPSLKPQRTTRFAGARQDVAEFRGAIGLNRTEFEKKSRRRARVLRIKKAGCSTVGGHGVGLVSARVTHRKSKLIKPNPSKSR